MSFFPASRYAELFWDLDDSAAEFKFGLLNQSLG